MIQILFLFPVVSIVAILLFRSRALNILANLMYAAVFLAVSIVLCISPSGFTVYFQTDHLNIWFLLILATVYLGVSIFNIDFLKHNDASPRSQALYFCNLLLFVASMAGVILSTHLALLWVFVEATTLSSSYLIYFSRSDASLEATWKYLFICSIGIAIAFMGIIFLSMGLAGNDSLFFNDLYMKAGAINPFWLKLSYPFILIGFGTKVGFGPMHAWLPDAHSESPSPISALLSGTLLNAAFLGIIRVNKLMDIANMGHYVSDLLILIGFISIFVSAVYIISIKNYKRMLAYSSIENMGIIAISLGIGGAGLFAALLHLAAHSLTKAAFFLTSGNILHRYKTKSICEVRGLLKQDPATGWLWIFCFAGIVGLPPFPLFISEFLIIKTMFMNGQIVIAILFFLLLTIIMAGIGRAVLRMSFGNVISETHSGRFSPLVYMPQMAFMLILLILGISMPEGIYTIIENAVRLLTV